MSFYSVFAADYERVFPFRDEVYRFLRLHAGEPGCRVLDVGCGPGHYSGRFASDGYAATGIDLDSVMISEAVMRYPQAAFRCIDMRDVDEVGGGFRCVYSIGNVVSHLCPEDLARFLVSIANLLEPGGIWIMQVMNWDAFTGMDAYEFPVRLIDREGEQAAFHRQYRFDRTGTVKFSVSFRQSDRDLFDEQTTIHQSSLDRYLHLHELSGFSSLSVHSDFNGTPIREVPGTGLVMAFRKR